MRTDVATPRLQRPDGRSGACPGTSGPVALANAPPACGRCAGIGRTTSMSPPPTGLRPLSRGRAPYRGDRAPPTTRWPLSRRRAHAEATAHHPLPGGRLAGAGPIPERPRPVTAHRPAAGGGPGPTDRRPRGPAPGAVPSTSSSGGGTGVQGGRRPSRSDATAGSALDARPGTAIITNRAAPSPRCSLPGTDATHRPAAGSGPGPTDRRPQGPAPGGPLPALLAPGHGCHPPARGRQRTGTNR